MPARYLPDADSLLASSTYYVDSFVNRIREVELISTYRILQVGTKFVMYCMHTRVPRIYLAIILLASRVLARASYSLVVFIKHCISGAPCCHRAPNAGRPNMS